MAYIYPANFTPQRRHLGAYLLNGPRNHARPRRRGMRGMGDDTLPLTAPNDYILDPLTPMQPAANTGMIAAGTPLAPPGQNYNPALNTYFNPSPVQAAQIALNSLAPVGGGAPIPPGLTSGLSSSTVLLLAAGVAAIALVSSGGSGKRRR